MSWGASRVGMRHGIGSTLATGTELVMAIQEQERAAQNRRRLAEFAQRMFEAVEFAHAEGFQWPTDPFEGFSDFYGAFRDAQGMRQK